MPGNGATLPEDRRVALIAAAISSDESRRPVVAAAAADEDPRIRQLAVRAGARRGWMDDDAWRAALTDPDPTVRRETATQLARGGAPALHAELTNLLVDADPLVAEAAAYALGERSDSRAVPALIDMASHHDDARCREAAVAALGNIGDDRGRTALIGALSDKAPVRRRAVVALANFEGDDVDAALALAADDRDWQVRAAVDLLGREPDD